MLIKTHDVGCSSFIHSVVGRLEALHFTAVRFINLFLLVKVLCVSFFKNNLFKVVNGVSTGRVLTLYRSFTACPSWLYLHSLRIYAGVCESYRKLFRRDLMQASLYYLETLWMAIKDGQRLKHGEHSEYCFPKV